MIRPHDGAGAINAVVGSGTLITFPTLVAMGYPPVTLNRLAPELTERMVAKIFATDLNDWPAILRAMRETGEEFRQGKVTSLPASFGSPQP